MVRCIDEHLIHFLSDRFLNLLVNILDLKFEQESVLEIDNFFEEFFVKVFHNQPLFYLKLTVSFYEMGILLLFLWRLNTF